MIPKRAFWFVAGAAAGAAGVLRAEAELRARQDQLTPANLARGAAGMVAGTAADASGKVGDKVKEHLAQRSANGAAAREPWAPRDWSGGTR